MTQPSRRRFRKPRESAGFRSVTLPPNANIVTRSHCKICTNQCGVVFEVANNEIVRIKGDFDHPLSKGYTCPKGRAIGKLHHHPDAITQPMMRRDGELVPVSWDECLDDLAMRLK